MKKIDFKEQITKLHTALKGMEEALATVEEVAVALEELGERDTHELPWEEDALLAMIEEYRQAPCEDGYAFLDRTAAMAVLVRAYEVFYAARSES